MKKWSLYITFIICLISINNGEGMDTKQALILDILQFQERNIFQSRVGLYLCSNFVTTYKMIRNFSQHYTALSVHMTSAQVIRQMRAIYDDSRSTFVLDMSCRNAATILQEADKLNLFNSRYKWILLEGCSEEIRETNKVSHTTMQQFVTQSTEAVQEKTPIAEENNLFENEINSYPETMETQEQLCEQLESTLIKLNIFIDSDVTVAERVSTERFKLYQTYRIGDYQHMFSNIYGEWVNGDGLYINKLRLLTSGRMNLHKSLLKAALVLTNNNSILHLTDAVDKHIDSVSKVAYALYRHVVDILNATTEITVTNSWGRLQNGTWSGMCGLVQRREVDIGITPMFILKNRLNFIHYVHSTPHTMIEFIFRQPPLSFVENIFTLPFSRAVWIGSTALIGFIAILLYYTLKMETHVEGETHGKQMNITWSDMLLLSVGAVCQQGTLLEGKRIPGRIIVLFLFVIVIFLYTSYSAYIVVLLQSTTTSIRTLNDLLHSGITLSAHDISYNHLYIKNVTDPVRRAIYTQRISPPGGPERFYNMADGLDRVRKGLFAFHLELAAGYKTISDTYTEDEKCNLQTMKFLIEIPDPWVTIYKKSPYKEIVGMGYRMVHERGFQYRENHRFYYRKPECSSRGTNFVSVGIIDCYSALLMLGFGMLAAIAILLVEIIVHRKLARKICIQNTDNILNVHNY